MKLIIRKIATYQYKSDSIMSDFDYASAILNQSLNPTSSEPKSVTIEKVNIVYTSSLKRSIGCIKKLKNQTVFVCRELSEIPFEIKDHISTSTYAKHGSKSVRKAFIKGFIEDSLIIKRKQIFSEIESLLKKMKNTNASTIGVISHSFRMKVLQAYLETKGKIKTNPSLIKKFVKINERTFNFGEGFDFNI